MTSEYEVYERHAKQFYTGTYTQPSPADIELRRAALAPFDGWNERAFCQIVAWIGIPPSFLDLGSGTGAMVNLARKMGVEAYGVDVINGPGYFITHDLRQPLDIGRTFAVVTCLEVAEHIDMDAHETLCDTIQRHLAPGGKLLFSAAPPGQKGEHHVGCRPAAEWRAMLHERHVSYREDYTRQICHLLGWVAGPMSHWLAANLMVFDTWDGEWQQER